MPGNSASFLQWLQPQEPLGRQRSPWAHVVDPHVHRPPLHVPVLPALQSPFSLQVHCPAAHPKPEGQECPHAPQLVALVIRFTQPLGVSQHVRPVAHAEPPLQLQSPLRLHVSPCAHTAAPQ